MAEKLVQKEAAFSQLGVGKLRPGTLQVTLADEVTSKDLHELIDRIINLNGCRTCGLGGIDIFLHGGDPMINQQFADIAAVRAVTLVR